MLAGCREPSIWSQHRFISQMKNLLESSRTPARQGDNSQEQTTITELDRWRAAHLLISQCDHGAQLEAAMQGGQAVASEDVAAVDFWADVLRKVRQLQRRKSAGNAWQ